MAKWWIAREELQKRSQRGGGEEFVSFRFLDLDVSTTYGSCNDTDNDTRVFTWERREKIGVSA